MTESVYSFNFKLGTGYDAPMFTVRGDSAQTFQANIQAVTNSAIGGDLNAMIEAVTNTSALNKVLGATGVDPAQNAAPVQQEQPPQQQVAPPQRGGQDPWQQGGGQPQGQWAQPPQQQAAPPQQGNGQWGTPPPAQGGWGGQPQGGGDYRADPTIQPPHLQPPMTPFGPAKYKGGFAKGSGKPYRVWSDPRPYPEIKNLPKDQQFSQFIKDSEL